jgi:hypothetical protein
MSKLQFKISMENNVTDQLMMRFLHLSDNGKKWECNEAVHQLFIDFKKAYDSVRKEVLYP